MENYAVKLSNTKIIASALLSGKAFQIKNEIFLRQPMTDDQMTNDKKKCPVCGAYQSTDHQTVTNLFKLWSDEPKLNTGAKVLTGRLIAKFGYEAVREAFIQASTDNNRMTLAYVRGILLKKEQQAAAAKSKAEAAALNEDTKIIAKDFNLGE